jgi:hypothetical protein
MLGFKRNAKGKLERIKIGLRKIIRMPTTATDHVMKEMVKETVDRHGIKVNFDTKTVLMNIEKMLKEKVAWLGYDHSAVKDGITLQLLGDGYNHFRRLSIINLCVRIMGADVFANACTSLLTAGIWEGAISVI